MPEFLKKISKKQWLVIGRNAAILVLLLLSNSMGLLNSLYIAVYQLIWMIPLAISSRMFIR